MAHGKNVLPLSGESQNRLISQVDGHFLNAFAEALILEIFIHHDHISLQDLMGDLEKRILARVLFQHSGDIRRSSQVLGIEAAALLAKLKRYNLCFCKTALEN